MFRLVYHSFRGIGAAGVLSKAGSAGIVHLVHGLLDLVQGLLRDLAGAGGLNGGAQGMAEFYAKASRGDALGYKNTVQDEESGSWESNGGHARLLAYDPVILRSYDGVIDLKNSYVITHEQGDGLYDCQDANGKYEQYEGYGVKQTSWRIDFKYPLDVLMTAEGHKGFKAATGKTAGERLYLQYGIRGIRGEAADGFPSVKNIGLPHFRQARAEGVSQNGAGVLTLLHLIAQVQDTTLYHRGGCDGAQWAAAAAKKLLPCPSNAQIAQLDDAFIARNLSPGGCADLLAATYFLHSFVKQA